MSTDRLSAAQLEQFRSWSTCVVSSAIETFDVRLPNTGFADSRIRCMFPAQAPVIGYAATARIRTSNPPMERHTRFDYYDRADWWQNVLTIPAPRVVVIQDVDDPPGLGAFIGEVHANILLSLGCVAVVTNGAVRDLVDIGHTEFQMFAGNVSVSHAYAHLFDFGTEVAIGGLTVKPGDLVHGDLHGVQTVPLEIASRVAQAAQRVRQRRSQLLALRRSTDFSIDKLRRAIQETSFGANDGE